MKKNVLAIGVAAAVAAFAGAANAQIVEPTTGAADKLAVQAGGIGHILLTPYFTTQDGNATLLNIVNTDTTNGKAVKVRFRGAANSDDVFDFTLFLSPGDVWTATVSEKNGRSHLVTSDNSCTLPAAVASEAGNPFVTTRVKGEAAHTREGYIEILNTADIPPAAAGGTNSNLYTAIKHKNGVAPCGDLKNSAGTPLNPFSREHRYVNNTPADPDYYVTRGYDFPSGGLFANWTVVNLASSATSTGAALAVAAVDTTNVPALGNIVVFPQNANPVTIADAGLWTADPLLVQAKPGGGQYVKTANYDFPDLSTPYVPGTFGTTTGPTEQANELSASLAVSQISNEYLSDGIIATDWVFSLPTRRYGVAYDYDYLTNAAPGATKDDALIVNTANLFFNLGNTAISNLEAEKDRILVKGFELAYLDREETGPETPEDDFVISPGEPSTTPELTFPGEVTVLSFNDASVTGASIATKRIDTKNGAETLKNGWLNITVQNNATGATVQGLPIIGYAAARTNSSSNLGGTWPHRWVPAN